MQARAIPNSWLEERSRIRGEILRAIERDDCTIRVGHYRNFSLIPALHEFVFSPDYSGLNLGLLYEDGSKSAGFQLGLCAPIDLNPDEEYSTLNVGLMTRRHVEVDFVIDCYATRNIVLSRDDVSDEEVEALAYDQSVSLLYDAKEFGALKINLLHSGYIPTVVGFYRALSRIIWETSDRVQRRSLLIYPHFFHPVTGVPAEPTRHKFSHQSRGAKLENYIIGEVWG